MPAGGAEEEIAMEREVVLISGESISVITLLVVTRAVDVLVLGAFGSQCPVLLVDFSNY